MVETQSIVSLLLYKVACILGLPHDRGVETQSIVSLLYITFQNFKTAFGNQLHLINHIW